MLIIFCLLELVIYNHVNVNSKIFWLSKMTLRLDKAYWMDCIINGFHADLCKTGSSGVEYARQQSPHLILLDIRLPDGSGFDFCRQMRQMGWRQPIIMLTAQHDEVDKVLGLEMAQTII